MEWQSIETAPRNHGSEYLVSNDRGVFAAEFDPDWFDDGWWLISDGKDFERPLRGSAPTHWMPLPPPPTSPASEQALSE
jgi:Protein of unknown function (DUF551)